MQAFYATVNRKRFCRDLGIVSEPILANLLFEYREAAIHTCRAVNLVGIRDGIRDVCLLLACWCEQKLESLRAEREGRVHDAQAALALCEQYYKRLPEDLQW